MRAATVNARAGLLALAILMALGESASADQRGAASMLHSVSKSGINATASYGTPRHRFSQADEIPADASRDVVVVPVAVALVPHTCAPRYGTGGVPLTFTFADTTGDCATFTSPEPVEQRPGRPGRPPRPSPEEIARTLADRAVSLAPEPDLQVTPSGIGLTGLESYFWLETSPEPIEATAQAGPVLVTAQARAVQYVWNFGDGSDMVTTGSGRRWSASRGGNIGHVYETRGRYELAVDVVWEARWRIGEGPWQSLGYFSNSDSRPYRVRQVIAVLTEPE